ncbi:type VI secretion system lipoprotein TssJ [Chitinimonas lacunae]|uniref:Type VI secretion system lipoprotein TssJ n=1 Tax=Chitinimonas lacunae TaxID=1963018 RepID=A0ABV8MU18_9NEIS
MTTRTLPSIRWRPWLALALATALAGCATPTLTMHALTQAQPNANPDANGRASPIVVRLYQLKAPANFQGADFFSLYERDRQTLGEEFIQSEELVLLPGEARKIERQITPETRYLGVIAAFRAIEQAQWRGMFEVTSGHRSTLISKEATLPIEIEVSDKKVEVRQASSLSALQEKAQQAAQKAASKAEEEAKKGATKAVEEQAQKGAKKLLKRVP